MLSFFGASMAMTAIITGKKTATRIVGFLLQYLLPLYPHEPITKPYHLTSVRVSKRADCWMQKNSVGQPSKHG